MEISGAAPAGSIPGSVQYAISVSMMKNAMNLAEDTMDTLFEDMGAALTGLGQNIDQYA